MTAKLGLALTVFNTGLNFHHYQRRNEMALADYMLCCVCTRKTFYDSNLNYDFNEYPETGLYNTAEVLSLCIECAKTHSLEVVNKSPLPEEQG